MALRPNQTVLLYYWYSSILLIHYTTGIVVYLIFTEL